MPSNAYSVVKIIFTTKNFADNDVMQSLEIMLLQMTFVHKTNAATTSLTQQLSEYDSQAGNTAALSIIIHDQTNYSFVQWFRIPATSCTKYIMFVTHKVHKPVAHYLEILVKLII